MTNPLDLVAMLQARGFLLPGGKTAPDAGLKSKSVAKRITVSLGGSVVRSVDVRPAGARTCIEHPEIAQGTPEWMQLRAGIPTSSRFDDIVTASGNPTTGASRDMYMNHLLAERILGCPIDAPTTKMMDRGHVVEPVAIAYYEAIHDDLPATIPVGFVTNAEKTAGASPDRLVGEDGLLECKAPGYAIHMSYLRRTDGAYKKYRVQVQGQLWICQRLWCDTLSYCEPLPDALYRVERDREFIGDALEPHVGKFIADLEIAWQECKDNGWAREIAQARRFQKSNAEVMAEVEAMAQAALKNGGQLPNWARQ